MNKELQHKTNGPQIWDAVWQQESVADTDHLSEMIFRVVAAEFGKDFRGRRVLEVGCGSGRISAGMAALGAELTLLDYSRNALSTAREQVAKRKVRAELVCGSMFGLPFENGTFDLVWNAGVLEHYGREDQRAALREMLRVCKPDGVVITLNPSSRAYVYRVGKFIEERLGKWKYGYEKPIGSLAPILATIGIDSPREFTVGFYEQFTFLRSLPGIRGAAHRFVSWARVHWPDFQPFSGYLLTTVFRKQGASESHDPAAVAL